MKPFHLTQHKLEDTIVKDSIIAINKLKGKTAGRIAGGMAVQSYIPERLHRGTIDLDFTLYWKGCISEFKELCKPLVSYLKNQNYNINFHKKGQVFEITFGNKKDSFLIQHPRFSKNYFERIKNSLGREISNQRTISKEGLNYGVLSPEDLVVTKLHRALLFSEKYNIWTPKEVSVKSLRNFSRKLRNEITSRSLEVSPKKIALLRLVNDCYDIKSLSENIGLNKNYFNEVVNDWKNHKAESKSFLGLLEKLKVPLE